MVPPIPPEASKEIDFVKGLVAKHFPVYDVRVSYDVVQFFCRVDSTTLEESFEQMREDMAPHGYIPMITYEGGEHIVQVARKPKMKYRSIYVNIGFFIATFFTMVLAGVLYWDSYAGSPSGVLFTIESIEMGIVMFTLPLMAILGIHELGHFFMARKRKIAASLPFFIPSIPPLGTFGAFISLRDPIPNKKALLEIGVAGPLCGLALAVPLGIVGLMLTNDAAKLEPQNIGSGVVGISFSLLFRWLAQLVPISGPYMMHPTAFAAWVGILVTAINLLPVGQLDGGHVARALLGNNTKYLSYAVAAILIGLSVFFTAWILFAMLVLILGVKHPPPLNDISPLDTRRKLVGVLAFGVLVISFVPQPMFPIFQDYQFEMSPVSQNDLNGTIQPGDIFTAAVYVNNTGNTYNEIGLKKVSSPLNWNVEFRRSSSGESNFSQELSVILNNSQSATVDVRIFAAADTQLDVVESVVIRATATNASIQRELTFNLTVVSPALTYWIASGVVQVPRGSHADALVMLNNSGDLDANITLITNDTRPMFVSYQLYISTSPDVQASSINVIVPANASVSFGVNISAESSASVGSSVVFVDMMMYSNFIGRIAVTIDVI